MTNNQKNFNIYVFISTFARSLIEVFVPLILFKFGYSLKEVSIYFLIMYIFSTVLAFPCIYISKKYNSKILSYISIAVFTLLQIFLNKMVYSYIYIILLAFLYALYRRSYWISRRFYNLNIMPEKNISKTYSVISIINQIGIVLSSYAGSLVLDYISLNTLTIISVVLFLLSTIPLYMLKFEDRGSNVKIELLKNMKRIAKSDLYLFGSYEILNVIKFLFPLYTFIYIKSTYQTVGLLELLTNLANILFVYLYGKKINNNKNYIKLSIFLVVTIYVLKANILTTLILVISFFEGIFTKMYELSISKEFYTLSKKFEYYNYNLIYETMQNVSRMIIMFIICFFSYDIRIMIYISLFVIGIGILLKFKSIDKAEDLEVTENNETRV